MISRTPEERINRALDNLEEAHKLLAEAELLIPGTEVNAYDRVTQATEFVRDTYEFLLAARETQRDQVKKDVLRGSIKINNDSAFDVTSGEDDDDEGEVPF